MGNSKYLLRQTLKEIFVIALCLTNFNGARSECNGSEEWECDNGECIQDKKMCDGRVDCRDRSDETPENCIHLGEICPKYAFRCSYGACIDGKSRCNGVQDCEDNSDEWICKKKNDSDFQGSCSDTEIQCQRSGECINSILLCDGIPHCQDGSDEWLELCINYGCVSFGFQCGNGACINGKSKCNGVRECIDGSDEAWQLCNTPRKNMSTAVSPTPTPPMPTSTTTPAPSQNNRCFIPNTPALKNLDFKLHPQNQTIPLDSYVDEYEVVHIECKTKYTLQGQSSLICQNGEWNTKFPTCDGYCDGTLLSSLSLRAICDFRQRFVQCPEKISPETNIQVNCAFGYTRKDKTPQYLRCLPDGSFDKMPEHCEQTCGKISPTSTTLSKNGIEIDVSLAPWHVAIYENNTVDYIYKCGGSIISPSLIITAAHCFWDEATLKVISFTHYTIIAGRSANKYTTEQNLYSQTIKVKEIHVPVEYEGRKGRQKDDIAFLKLETPLKYSETISPICIPKELRNTASKYVRSNNIGFINGFGPENKLERLKMLTLEYYECLDKSPQDAPVADDKFCVYNTEGSLVCRGDSGGGYFVQSKDSDTAENIYRLWGVVSNTPTTANECTRTGDKAYVAITNIFNTAYEFKRKLNNARVEDEALF